MKSAVEAASSFTCEHADDALTATPVVSGVYLRVLADVVTRCGVAQEALLEHRLHEFRTREPVEVRTPLHDYRKLLERAVVLTGDPAIGLHCGVHAAASAYDILGPLVSHVRTLRDAIHEIQQFQSLGFDGAFLHLSQSASTARLRWEFPRDDQATDRSIAEFLIASVTRMLRAFGGAPGELRGAFFEHHKPGYHPAYREVFDGKERFSCAFTGLEFDAGVLDRPHLHANLALQHIVHAQAEQCLARVSQPTSLVDRLRVFLINEASAGVPDMAVAARHLGVSVRSLRRRLTERGISYRNITQEAQLERACALLRNLNNTLQDVAKALGFADTAAFHRAFKRLTGQTACEYRRTHAQRDQELQRSTPRPLQSFAAC